MIPFGCVHGWRSLFGICEKHQRYRSVQKRIEFDFVAVVREVLRSLLLADIAVAVPTVLHAAPKPPPQQIDIDVAPNGDVKTLEQAPEFSLTRSDSGKWVEPKFERKIARTRAVRAQMSDL